MSRIAYCFVLIAAVTLHTTLAHANQPTFVPLGDLPGGNFRSVAFAVSADGATIVGQGTNNANVYQPFAWDVAGGIRGLGTPPVDAVPQSLATAVSADGSIVVGSNVREAFVWKAAGDMFGLGVPPRIGGVSEAHGVTADGSLVVGYYGGEAVAWPLSGSMFKLGFLPGGSGFSSARDVSADGSTIVGLSHGNNGREAFVWTSSGGMVGLGDPAGGDFSSSAQAVSADGATVVGSGVGADGFEAFVWTDAGGMVSLGDLPGEKYPIDVPHGGFAYDVSADGSIIVGAATSDRYFEAVIWDAVNGIRSLNDILTTAGVDLNGWLLTSAHGISDDGRVIVGAGINPSGHTEAWMVTLAPVPEPSGYSQFAFGAIMAANRAWPIRRRAKLVG